MKYKTQWDLTLLYKNEKDPQIERDMQAIELACIQFEKKYKGKDFISTPSKLLAALKSYGNFLVKSTYKPMWYLHLYKDVENSNSKVVSLESQITQRQRIAFNKVLFFELELSKISKEKQLLYLKNEHLKYFSYYLKKIFDKARYNLSEKEEQIFSLLSQPGEKMWFDAQRKLLSEQEIFFKDKLIPLSEASEIIPTLKKQDRYKLYNEVIKVRKSTAFLATAEINAIYNFKKISDEKRGFKKPYSETLLRYENDEKEIMELVKSITNSFPLSKRFYKLLAKLHGETTISMADIYLSLGKIKKEFDFDSAVTIVKRAFSKFDAKYSKLLEEYLEKGQIDIYPREGKCAGGYCSGLAQFPVFILLNHTMKLSSVETLAHEMGHAIHTELSKPLDPFYGEYTLSVAEVASTFFEQFVSDELVETLPEDQKIILLHERIGRDMQIIFRQIACFNCENELHDQIRVKGQLTKTEMAQIMQKHLKSYIGNTVEITEDDGYVYTSWVHLRYSFYVYTYAYGGLVSRALYEKWKKDNSFKTKIEQFLSAGNSMSPKDIFKSIGINTNVAFFEAGLKGIERDIDKLEKLSKKWPKMKK